LRPSDRGRHDRRQFATVPVERTNTNSDQTVGPTGVDGGGPLGGAGLCELAVSVVAGLFAFVVADGCYAAVVGPTDGVVHGAGPGDDE
jgi:hypothetical protein